MAELADEFPAPKVLPDAGREVLRQILYGSARPSWPSTAAICTASWTLLHSKKLRALKRKVDETMPRTRRSAAGDGAVEQQSD